MKHLLLTLTIALLSLGAFAQAPEQIQDGTGRNYKVVTEQNAHYPGGNQALYMELYKQMKYPAEAKEKGITGDVTVAFFVEADSTTSDVRALNDLGYGTAAEAERLIKNLKFAPALQGGTAIRQNMMLPVLFRIYD
jgi:TonB family protein